MHEVFPLNSLLFDFCKFDGPANGIKKTLICSLSRLVWNGVCLFFLLAFTFVWSFSDLRILSKEIRRCQVIDFANGSPLWFSLNNCNWVSVQKVSKICQLLLRSEASSVFWNLRSETFWSIYGIGYNDHFLKDFCLTNFKYSLCTLDPKGKHLCTFRL